MLEVKSLEFRKKQRELIFKNVLSKFDEDQKFFHMHIEDRLFNIKGEVFNVLGKKLKLQKNQNGYLGVNVKYFKKGRRFALVHRLICEICLGYDSTYRYETNHIDCDKQNNHISNLEFLTREENLEHYRDFKNKKVITNKISSNDLLEMKEFRQLGFSIKQIAKAYKTSETYASKLINGTIRRKNDYL